MNIEIITTKDETSREAGFGNITTCNNILNSINSMGYNAILNVCQTIEHLNDVVNRDPDLVILAVKYIITEDEDTIWLSEFFAENKINFSGSSKDSLMFDSDKVLAKSYLKDKGLSTPRYFTAVPGEYKRDYDIPINYPLYVKPIHSLDYNGLNELSLVNNFSEFENKVLSLYSLYNTPVLVEEYLDGKDYTVSIIKTENDDILVSAIEILTLKSDRNIIFLDEKVKKTNTKKFINIEDKVIKNRVKNLAIDAYIDLEIKDFGQIYIKTNRSGHCFFMQANLVPGMINGISSFTEAFTLELGLTYDEIIKLVVDEGISRVKLNNKLVINIHDTNYPLLKAK
ncbi:D-alanine--D-alanine ligase [Sulfurimonas sp.]